MVPTLTSKRDAAKQDAVLLAAVDLARAALEEVAEPGTVGAHSGMEMLGERLAMHWFECTSPGYHGWRWGVSVARVPRAKVATVCETNLLPGPEAVLAPEWLPYADRLAPGDLGAGDVLPRRPDDPNLEAGFEATGDEDVDQMAFFELGLGRPRVLAPEGRDAAATRWYAGESGPKAEIALKATARCATCGYFVPMAGALRAVFGVCANEWSPSDGRVVSLDHGCGAHSETDVEQPEPTPIGEPIVDEFAVDLEQVLPTDDDATSPEDSTVEVEVAGEPAPEAVQSLEGEAAGAEAEEGVVEGDGAEETGERD
ncbi:MAG TPA: DUF3027 domain-containing protein [Intrasporangium sp.]|nr:DUF3027 domain-containing protein [Intrasporangium sp.]